MTTTASSSSIAHGAKLSDELEERIESELAQPVITRTSRSLGRATRVDRSRIQYQEFCASTLPSGIDLTGLKIVVDCANGAAYKVGPRVLADLGAEIVPIGCSPNGRNINDGCGSTAPELLQLTVPGVRAHVGVALDGDGDRLVMVDHLGRILDGDQLLYIIAQARRSSSSLRGPVVGTVMSNLGLEVALRESGIEFRRAPVGDRYVLSLLRETGGILGGETSGHIICLDKTTTGDGIVSALQVLAVMKQTGRSLAELASGMRKFPQVLLNVKVAARFDPADVPAVRDAVQRIEKRMNGRGQGRPASLRHRAGDPRDGGRPGRERDPSRRHRARRSGPRSRRPEDLRRSAAGGYYPRPRYRARSNAPPHRCR